MKIYQSFILTTALFAFAYQPVQAELEGTFPLEGGPITLTPTDGPIQAGAVEFSPAAGAVTAGRSPAPFAFFLSNGAAPENVTLGVLGTPVTIDGPVTLDVTASADAVINAIWGRGTTPVPFPVTASSDSQPLPYFARRPFAGGPITIAPFFGNAAIPLTGILLNASSGELTSGGNAAPFETLETNTPNSWSASSSVPVLIDGPTELDVIASADSRVDGLFLGGSTTADLTVLVSAPPTDTQIVGRYSIEGGPISIQSTQPVSIRQLQLNSSGGSLIGGTSAAPFENVVSNTDTQWTVSSNASVVLNGSVDLDVQVEPNTFVKGFTNDGVATSAFQLYALSEEDLDAELFGIFPREGGLLSVITTKGPVTASGLQFESNSAGALTPSQNSAPFAFSALSFDSRVATFGTLADVELDGPLTLGLEVSADAVIDSAQRLRGFGHLDFPVVGGLFDTGLTREPDRLAGSYSLAGGPVSIQATGDPVPLRELELVAAKGSLIDQDSAAPFESVTTSGTSWTAQSSVDVMIDGEIVLGVEVAPFSLIRAIGHTSDDTFAFSLNSFTEDVIESELVAVFPEGGGKVTVFATDEPITTDSIEFATDDVGAVTAGFDPAPFDFFLSDPLRPNTIILGMNSGTVTIDGSLTLDVTASSDAEFFGTWGEGVLRTFPAIAVPNVPEPNSQLLTLLGVLGFMSFLPKKSR